MTARLRACVAIGLMGVTSCVPESRVTRRERGPLLRTYERDGATESLGVRADLHGEWPQLKVRFLSVSRCRKETVREYPEEVVTERSAPAAGPEIAMGGTAAVVGIALLALRGLFSDQPNRNQIDGGGQYGASERTVATVWAISLVAIGVPSVVFGGVQLAQEGEQVTKHVVADVVDVKEARCDERPVDGKAEVLGPSGVLASQPTQGGEVALSAEALKGTVVGLALNGTHVALDEDDQEELQAFRACVRSPPFDETTLAGLSAGELILRQAEAQQCARISGSDGARAAVAISQALAIRHPSLMGPEPGVSRFNSMEEAMAAMPPALQLAPGSADLNKLADVGPLQGLVASVTGRVSQLVGADLALVSIGNARVWLQVDGEWAKPTPRLMDPLEAIAVVIGKRTVERIEAPLLRVVYVRKSPPPGVPDAGK